MDYSQEYKQKLVSADEAVKAYISGNLVYNPDIECKHHEHEHGHGGDCGSHGCGEHTCGDHGCHH